MGPSFTCAINCYVTETSAHMVGRGQHHHAKYGHIVKLLGLATDTGSPSVH